MEFFPLGTTSVTFNAIDALGNTGTAQATVTVVDTTMPVLIVPGDFTVEPTGQTGANVVLPEATATDIVDPAPVVSCTASSGLFPLGTTLLNCTATDFSDNIANGSFNVTVTDTGAPSIAATVEPPPNVAGWNNTDVMVTFICTDAESGIATCLGDQTVTAEGANQSVEGTATDLDGNIATTTVNINLDKTLPTVIITSPTEDSVFLLSDVVSAVWAANDELSGIASEDGTVEPGWFVDTSTQGLHSFNVTATDQAGNTANLTHSYSVLAPFARFEVEKGLLEQDQGAATDDFELEGSLEPADTSNGIDVANEAVTVTFDGFTETILAGSFVRNADDDGFEFGGVSGGITQARVKDDGRFLVRGKGLDLGSIVSTDPVFFSIRIGDEVGQTEILFGVEPFQLEVREAKDLFGTVVSVTVLPDGLGVLVIKTKDGIVDVLTDAETQFTLPRPRDPRIDDLVVGDLIEVSLEEEDGVLVADKVVLVPGKTQHRHIPGEIVSLIVDAIAGEQIIIQPQQITIQPPGARVEQVTFDITNDTTINLRGGIDELSLGLFVVVSAIRDPLTGEISGDALEINVTRGRPTILRARPPQAAKSTSRNSAEVRGVLGLDALGNWTVNGIVVAIDPDTEIEGGLVVGQTVEVEGVLQEDGTILALEIETKDEDDVVSSKTELEGIFQGIDPDTGKWIISGNLVEVGPGTDTDGLPFVGQRVEVEALLQENGALLAREIENKGGSADEEEESSEVELEGTFLGVDPDGKWVINGASVLVDPLTRLQGAPAIGQRVEVKALLQGDGSLVAQKIKGKGRDKSRSNKAKVRGIVEDILDDGTLVVDGVSIALSVLTELDIDPEIGDSVAIEASLQPDGSLVASEVEEEGDPETGELPEASEAEIEGTIELVNPDGSLVVNGITVFIDADAEIKGNLVEGAEVKLEGFLQENGTIVAQELKTLGEGATAGGTELEVEGLVEDIRRDSDGNILEILVDGQTISADALTRFEGLLEVGESVEVDGLEINGQFVASKIEGEENRGASKAEKEREKAEEKAEKEQEKAEDKAEREREKAEEQADQGRGKPEAEDEKDGGDTSSSGSNADSSDSDSLDDEDDDDDDDD